MAGDQLRGQLLEPLAASVLRGAGVEGGAALLHARPQVRRKPPLGHRVEDLVLLADVGAQQLGVATRRAVDLLALRRRPRDARAGLRQERGDVVAPDVVLLEHHGDRPAVAREAGLDHRHEEDLLFLAVVQGVGVVADEGEEAEELRPVAATEPDLLGERLEGVDAAGNRRWRLTFIDFGMVGRVPETLRTGLREVLIAVGTQDGPRLVQSFKALGVLLPSADLKLIEMASMQLFERFGGMSMSELREIDHDEMARFALQFRELMLDLPFQLPENLLLLGRSVAILSGMCTGLEPRFNLWDSLGPYAGQLVSDEGGNWWDTVLSEGTKILQTTIGLPGRADRVLSQIERGELNVQSPMLELRVRRLERSVGRVVNALLFTGLLVAGAILYPAEPTLAKWLMVASIVPLVGAMRSRGGHPGR